MNSLDTDTTEIDIIFVPKRTPQFLAATAVSLGSFALGAVLAWTSPALPSLEALGSIGELTSESKSWIASLVTCGALVSGPFAGFFIERIGRRMSMLLFAILLFIGWLLVAFAVNVAMMCVGRFITGICIGSFSLIIPVYIVEISEESIRGVLNAMSPILCGLGILLTYIAGTFLSWFPLTLINAGVPIVLFGCIWFVPESPVYLVGKGKKHLAAESLRRLRGSSDVNDIEPELLKIQSFVDENSTNESRMRHGAMSSTLLLCQLSTLKPMMLVMVLMILQQLSGINALIFFSLHIFQLAGTTWDSNVQSIIVGVVIMIAVGLNFILIDRAGRRVLLIISQTGTAICMMSLGTFFYLKDRNQNETSPDGLEWLPITSLMAFMLLYNIGIGPMAWLLMGELLPSNVKGVASAIATSFNWMLAFVITKTFEDMTIAIGTDGCFWFFGSVCALGLVFCIFFIPETRGKTLDEIQKLYFVK